MPTRIALVEPYVYTIESGFRTPEGGEWLYVPRHPVRPHRASWKSKPESKYNTDPIATTTAELLAYSSDSWKFGPLWGLLATYTEGALVAVAERFDDGDDDYLTMLPVLHEMAEQHLDAMWFVG